MKVYIISNVNARNYIQYIVRHWCLVSMYVLLIGVVLFSVSIPACDTPPPEITVSDAALVDSTQSIYLAEVDEVSQVGDDPYQVIYKLKIKRTLKGLNIVSLEITGGIRPIREYSDESFGNHSKKKFKYNNKHAQRITGRSMIGTDCVVHPRLYLGKTYLIFVGANHLRAYEEILSNNDRWLKRIQYLVSRRTTSRN